MYLWHLVTLWHNGDLQLGFWRAIHVLQSVVLEIVLFINDDFTGIRLSCCFAQWFCATRNTGFFAFRGTCHRGDVVTAHVQSSHDFPNFNGIQRHPKEANGIQLCSTMFNYVLISTIEMRRWSPTFTNMFAGAWLNPEAFSHRSLLRFFQELLEHTEVPSGDQGWYGWYAQGPRDEGTSGDSARPFVRWKQCWKWVASRTYRGGNGIKT